MGGNMIEMLQTLHKNQKVHKATLGAYANLVIRQTSDIERHNKRRVIMEQQNEVYKTYTILKHLIRCAMGLHTGELTSEQNKAVTKEKMTESDIVKLKDATLCDMIFAFVKTNTPIDL